MRNDRLTELEMTLRTERRITRALEVAIFLAFAALVVLGFVAMALSA